MAETRSEMAARIEREVRNELASKGIYSGPEFYSVLNRRHNRELPQCRSCKHLLGMKGRDHLLVMPTGAEFGSCGLRPSDDKCNFVSVDVQGCDRHEHGPTGIGTKTDYASNCCPVESAD